MQALPPEPHSVKLPRRFVKHCIAQDDRDEGSPHHQPQQYRNQSGQNQKAELISQRKGVELYRGEACHMCRQVPEMDTNGNQQRKNTPPYLEWNEDQGPYRQFPP